MIEQLLLKFSQTVMMPNHPEIHSGPYGYLKQLRQLNISDFYSLCTAEKC